MKKRFLRDLAIPIGPYGVKAYLLAEVHEFFAKFPDRKSLDEAARRTLNHKLTFKCCLSSNRDMKPRSHIWRPIEDLPKDTTTLKSKETENLVATWLERAESLREKDHYKRFVERLRRKWAIETGVIERLYSISEGATRTLIEKGLDAALLSHGDTDRPPEEVIAQIRDQHNVIEGLYDFVSGQIPLNISYIKGMHQALTEHQPTYSAIDTLGNPVTRDLPRGIWKTLPNNVSGPDEFVFEFCPPEHVQLEMENLMRWHEEHKVRGIPPNVEAAWLHHRFTLIHPFTDGNGRVARCLATMVLLKAGWFPLVVSRVERMDYIEALRSADAGNLRPLVDLFNKLQKQAVQEALAQAEDIHAYDQVLSAVKKKFERVREQEAVQVDNLRQLAVALQDSAFQHFMKVAQDVRETVQLVDNHYDAHPIGARNQSDKARFNYIQIVQCVKQLDYFADFSVHQSWAGLAIKMDGLHEILLSFHGMGHGNSGIIACCAMYYSKESQEDGGRFVNEVLPLLPDSSPFLFTTKDDFHEVEREFNVVLEKWTIAGLDAWRKTIGA